MDGDALAQPMRRSREDRSRAKDGTNSMGLAPERSVTRVRRWPPAGCPAHRHVHSGPPSHFLLCRIPTPRRPAVSRIADRERLRWRADDGRLRGSDARGKVFREPGRCPEQADPDPLHPRPGRGAHGPGSGSPPSIRRRPWTRPSRARPGCGPGARSRRCSARKRVPSPRRMSGAQGTATGWGRSGPSARRVTGRGRPRSGS